MKKITLFLLFMISAISSAQLKRIEKAPNENDLIGKVSVAGNFAMKIEKLGDTYYFTYRDVNFKHIYETKEFKLQDIDNAFESLYAILVDGFESMPKESIELEFPDGMLSLQYTKVFGISSVCFYHTDKNGITGYTMEINRKQIDKLFGKKKAE